MTKKTVLTGITTTGTPHIGNYLGAIKPAIEASLNPELNSFFFLADYHALIKCHEPERVARSTQEIAATWLALGLDPAKAIFYRQSDIPEIAELNWLLTSVTSKGLMNRAHAYKASVDQNRDSGKEDLDDGITMGLFCYPILMAADILMFNADIIPVGKDQIQHIEMARDIAGRFNHTFEATFTQPEAQVDEDTQLIPGLDGRKMSKSYDNTIPLFCPPEQLRKLINQIKTDARAPGEAKDCEGSTVFQLYNCFASADQSAAMKEKFAAGIAWGDAKTELFELINAHISGPRDRYNELMNDLAYVEQVLLEGRERARQYTAKFIQQIRQAAGIRPLTFQPVKAETQVAKKEKSNEELQRAEQGRRRGILMQLKPVIEQVLAADDKNSAAQQAVSTKQVQVDSLKKKAKQKAENELEVLREELVDYLV